TCALPIWALKASNEVTRVSVDDRNPLGPGSLVVYLAGDDGPVSAEAVDEVDAALQARKAKTAIVETRNVTSAPIAVVGVVRIRSAFIAGDRKSTRLNSSHVKISYAVFCLKKKRNNVDPISSPRR